MQSKVDLFKRERKVKKKKKSNKTAEIFFPQKNYCFYYMP